MKTQKKYKTILVLGSAGQIGSSLVPMLISQGYNVLECDIEISLSHDLRVPNNTVFNNMIAKSDFVFFLAFDVGGSKYLKEKQKSYEFIRNNTEIMSNVFDVLEITKKPFIFVSSQLANNQESPYGIQKRIGEFYTYSLGGIVTRLWNVYGIEHQNEKSHVITDFVIQALTKNNISMLTDGQEKRQFLHADDCSNAFIALMEHYDSMDKTVDYHITNYDWVNILTVANFVSMLTSATVEVSASVDSIHNQDLYEPNTNILKIWQPKISLLDGIGKVIEYYRS